MNCPHCVNEIPDGSVFCNHCGMSTTAQRKEPRKYTTPIIGVAVVLFGLWFLIRYNAGSGPANALIAKVAHTPITLTDETENLRAASWKAIPVNTPYNGYLDVNLRVVRGNPLDVALITSAELDQLKKSGWSLPPNDVNFGAVKTAAYHRTAPLNQGNYYLVLRDTSLGIFSQQASDVAVKVVLKP